jgi:F-type H+-transporting ATPase subunit alpha
MYSQFEELETFARFGTQLDDETRRKLTRGRRVREVLKQPEHAHLTVPEQIAVLMAATQGLFDELDPAEITRAEATVRRAIRVRLPGLCDRIENAEQLSAADQETLIDTLSAALTGTDGQGADGDA